MSEHVMEPEVRENATATPSRRHQGCDQTLVLTELPADQLIDHLDGDDEPVELITFGTVRECCPSCQTGHLKLVLRQRQVRRAHLFCAECQRCFDAHYPSGASALTV